MVHTGRFESVFRDRIQNGSIGLADKMVKAQSAKCNLIDRCTCAQFGILCVCLLDVGEKSSRACPA